MPCMVSGVAHCVCCVCLIREHAEAIAFYNGDAEEASDLSGRLSAMIAVLLRRISWLGVYELWVHTYSYATILIPSLVLAPEYFKGNIEFGTLTQVSLAHFQQVLYVSACKASQPGLRA